MFCSCSLYTEAAVVSVQMASPILDSPAVLIYNHEKRRNRRKYQHRRAAEPEFSGRGKRVRKEKRRYPMDSYTSFAQVYDMFMDNVDYPAWCEYIRGLLNEYEITDGLILDLGCGTGNVTELLADAGYDMIGVDNSCDMLEIAEEKKEKSGHDILYLLQDMREFELYGTVRAVVSVCDSVNYILEEEELLQVFSLVNNYLDPGGIFLFDMNTRFKYEQMGECTIAENREESSFIWDNFYDPEDEINEYELAIFVRESGDLYRKFEETHYQRAYDPETVKALLEQAGLKVEAVYDAFTREPAREDSERIYFIAREYQKQKE